MTHYPQSLLLTAPYTLTWQIDTLPALGSHDVLLETIYGSLSIGTEFPQYLGDEHTDDPVTYPRMTGYESYAKAIAVGTDVNRLALDDRVIAFYGHRPPILLERLYDKHIMHIQLPDFFHQLATKSHETVKVLVDYQSTNA